MEKDLLDNFHAEFSEIENSENNDMMILFDLSTNGLWKIESEQQEVGGEVEWFKSYRIRHLISG